jgi:hypothetical protein
MSVHGRYCVGGDFNARIHFVRETDTDVCGPHILGGEAWNTLTEWARKPTKVEHFSSDFAKWTIWEFWIHNSPVRRKSW